MAGVYVRVRERGVTQQHKPVQSRMGRRMGKQSLFFSRPLDTVLAIVTAEVG